jgi:hypothetical protein
LVGKVWIFGKVREYEKKIYLEVRLNYDGKNKEFSGKDWVASG